MKRTFYLFILFSLSIFLLGCRSNGSGKGGGVDKEWSKFYRLDLAEAKAVVEWPTTINGNIVGKLFKITNDNKFVAVDPLDSQGDKVNINFMPMSLCNASPDYLMVWVSNDQGGDAPGAYLIRKEDGRIYQIPPVAGYPADYLRGNNRNRGYTVQSDAMGNLYYITRINEEREKEQVVKLTIGTGVTAKIISNKNDTNIYHFRVDKNGNVVYNYTFWNYFRLINTDGVTLKTFAEFYEDDKQAANCFLADGDIYLIGGKGPGLIGFQNWVIEKITVDAGGDVSLTEYKSGYEPHADDKIGFISDCLNRVDHEFNLQGHVFYIYNGSLIKKVTEVYSPSDLREIPGYFDLSSYFTDIYDYDHTGNELYFIGTDKTGEPGIVRFHPVTGEIEIYQVTSDYYFTSPPHHEKSIIALGNGEFLLEGRRMSDDRRVLLIADSSGFHEIAVMDPKYGKVEICFERVAFNVD